MSVRTDFKKAMHETYDGYDIDIYKAKRKPRYSNPQEQEAFDKGYNEGRVAYGVQKYYRKGSTLHTAYMAGYYAGNDDQNTSNFTQHHDEYGDHD